GAGGGMRGGRVWRPRAAALGGGGRIAPPAGEPLSPQLHVAVDSGGDRVARVAAPGVKRKDRSVLCRARVEVSPEARAAEAPVPEVEEVELFAEEVGAPVLPSSRNDGATPIDERTPAHGLPSVAEAEAPAAAEPEAAAQPEPAPAPPIAAPSEPSREPERIPGPPFVLPGRNGQTAEPAAAVPAPVPVQATAEAAPEEEITELDRDVAAGAR